RFDLNAPESFVHADPVRMQQVFWNVLKNAVRFSPDQGEITIRSQMGTEGRICLEIVDNGQGMNPEDMERIFQPFNQGKNGSRAGGLGLGLAISHQLIALHNGRIKATSAGSGCGATFTIELPLASPGSASATARSLGGSGPRQLAARRI